MGFWGTGAMDGDGPLDIRGGIAAKVADALRKQLASSDDGDVFAAARIGLDLLADGTLGMDYEFFDRGAGRALAPLMARRLTEVRIAEEWGNGVEEREAVRHGLLVRLADARNAEFAQRRASSSAARRP